MLRKVRNHEDAHSCLEAARASGLARAEWAHRNGVDARSLNAWRITLDRPRRRPQPPRLVELVPGEAPAARYVIRCGAMAVEVDDRFDADALRRLLGVVTSC